MDLSPGFFLHNRYKILRLLGQGGMGAVYLANDQSLATEVAVKINRSTSPKAIAQFIAEARLLATLRHPNLPRVIDYFQDESMGQFLVMDYIAGQDLRSLLEHNEIPAVDKVLVWAVQLGAALSYLHRQAPPIFHRDVKPANLKLSAQNEIILVDFGIAKAAESSQDTSTGAALLSPGYAPPEQYGVGHTGAYSDQYAMGATFYQLLTGQLPADAFQRLMGKATLAPVQSFNPAVPLHVDQALQRAMALRVEDRFPSVDDFVEALTHPSANASYLPTTPVGNYPPTLASGFPPPAQAYPPSGQPGYPPSGQPAYPPSGQPGYPPSGQPGYPPSGQPGYPPAGQPGYPPSGQPGYPPTMAAGNSQPPQPTFPPSQPPYPPTMGSGYAQPLQGGQGGQPPYPPNMVTGGYAPPPVAPAERRPWVWMVIGVFVLVVVIACGVLAILGAGDTSATPTATVAQATAIPATTVAPATATATVRTASPTATGATKTTTQVTLKPSATGGLLTRTITPTAPPRTATPTVITRTATRTPPGGATTPVSGAQLQNPAAYAVKYLTFFQDRAHGFSDLDWNLKLSTGAKVTAETGVLSILGGVEAITDKTDFVNELRIYLGTGTYGIGLKDFTLFVQRSSDGTSYLRMSCSDQPQGSSQILACEWYQMIAGKETRLENTAASLCRDICDIEVELDNGTFRVYANRQLKTTFKNTQLSTGAIGLRVNNPTQTPYTLDTISIYKLPKTSSVGSYLLLDDFGEEWPLGHTDNEFATIDRKISGETYNWVVKAKQDVFTRVNPTPDFIVPDRFIMYADVQQLNGPDSACYGMLFHYQDNSNFYYACATDSGTFSVYAKQNGDWDTLVDAVDAPDIMPGEVNSLSVRGDGSQYSFSVNDTLVTKITDDRFKNGTIGLAGELFDAGDEVEWDFVQVQVNILSQ